MGRTASTTSALSVSGLVSGATCRLLLRFEPQSVRRDASTMFSHPACEELLHAVEPRMSAHGEALDHQVELLFRHGLDVLLAEFFPISWCKSETLAHDISTAPGKAEL